VSADEVVDVVDEDDRVIGQASRAEIRRQCLRHRSVYILLFNSRGEIFVHRRTQTKDVYPGHWDVAVGGVVGSRESYDACAVRELAEEVGVVGAELRNLFSIRFEDERNRINGMVYACTTDQDLRLQAEEIETGKWIEPDEIAGLAQAEAFCPDGLFVFERYRSTAR
jgi:isopentenyldiphosphate isomerase